MLKSEHSSTNNISFSNFIAFYLKNITIYNKFFQELDRNSPRFKFCCHRSFTCWVCNDFLGDSQPLKQLKESVWRALSLKSVISKFERHTLTKSVNLAHFNPLALPRSKGIFSHGPVSLTHPLSQKTARAQAVSHPKPSCCFLNH